tara:strand:+ start:1190 stop:4000 length:2811 start_codon:yes stop_codon:yes gene_type:complete
MSQQEVVVGGVPMQFTFDDRDTDEVKESKIRNFLSTPEGQQSYTERQQAYQQSVASGLKAEQMSKDIDKMTPKKAFEATGYVLSHINRGLIGNVIDLPFMVGNLAIAGLNRIGGKLPPNAFGTPSQNFLGLDTGYAFDPDRQTQDAELKRKMRPLAVGSEFVSSFVLPQAVAGRIASGMRTPTITATKATSPTTVAQATLPAGSRAVPMTTTQEMTTKGAKIANNMMAGFSGLGAAGGSLVFRDSEYQGIAEAAFGIGSPLTVIAAAKGASAGGERLMRTRLDKNKINTETAIDILSKHAENAEQAVKTYIKNTEAGKKGSLASLTEDTGIAGLENSVRSRGQRGGDLKRLDQKVQEELKDTLVALGEDRAEQYFKNYAQNRLDTIKQSVQKSVDDAVEAAKVDRERVLRGVEDPSVASKTFYNEIDIAEKAFKEQAAENFAAIPKNNVDKRAVERFAKESLRKDNVATESAKEDIGKNLDKYLNGLLRAVDKGSVPVEELIQFRSSILRQIRNLQKQDDSNTPLEQFAKELQSGALDIIMKNPNRGKKYKKFADEYRAGSEIFNNAIFGTTDEAATIGASVLRPKEKGIVTTDQLSQIAGYNEGAIGAFKDYMRSVFKSTSIDDNGVIKPDNAARFIDNYREILARPEYVSFRNELDQVIASQRQSDQMSRLQKQSIADTEGQNFALWLSNENPKDAVKRFINKTTQPKKEAEILYMEASADPTGDALRGLQRNFADTLIDELFDPNKARSATQIKKAYEKIKPATDVVFKNNPESPKIIDEVVSDLLKMHKRKLAVGEDLSISNSEMAEILVRLVGVRLGRQVGNDIQTPALTAKALKKLLIDTRPQEVSAIIEEMIVNPRNFDDAIRSIKDAAGDEVEVIAATKGLIDSLSAASIMTRPVESAVDILRGGASVATSIPARAISPVAPAVADRL